MPAGTKLAEVETALNVPDDEQPPDESYAEELAEKAEAQAVYPKASTLLHNAYRGKR